MTSSVPAAVVVASFAVPDLPGPGEPQPTWFRVYLFAILTQWTVLSVAVATFNGGLRAYYFALAALGWFVHPLVFIGTVLWIVLVLLRRQFLSHTLSSVRAYEAVLEAKDSGAKISRE